MDHTKQPDTIQGLEGILSDPVVERVYKKAREYERLVNELESSPEEREQIIRELDSEWPYLGVPVLLSGRATFMCDEGELKRGKFVQSNTPTEHNFDNLPVVSNGFMTIEKPIIIDDEVVASNYEVVLSVIVQAGNGDGGITTFIGLAHIDGVNQEFPFESSESLIKKLGYYYEKDIESIDNLVLNARDETDAVKRLRHFVPDSQTTWDQPERFEIIENYMNHLITFDPSVPYSIKIEGDCFVYDVAGEKKLNLNLKPERHVAFAHRISYIAKECEGKTEFCPYLSTTILGDDPDSNEYRRLDVSLGAIKGMTSLRRTEVQRIRRTR